MRVGVVGVGWAGQQHIKAYSELDGVELVGIAGLEEAEREELAAEHGVEHDVARWEDLLELDGLEAVSVAVPTFLHAPIAIAALERGLHVLSEKPIALNGTEAGAMVDAARTAGRVLDVAFNHRRRGDVQRLKQVIDEGRLGRTYYAKAWWLRRTGIPTLGSWFTQSELAGGGPLVDIGVHVLDYALFLLGNPAVRSVSASTYDLLGRNGFGSSPESRQVGRRRRRRSSTSRISRPSSCASRTAARCCSRPAGPPTAPTATSSAPRSTAPRAAPSGSSTTTPRSAR